MRQRLFVGISFFILSICQCLADAEVKKDTKNSLVEYEVCCPIAVPPNSATTAVESKLLGDSEIELAIFLETDSSFDAIILWKKLDSYQCDVRVIYFKDVESEKGLDRNLISTCKVHVKSKPIDQKMVAILKATLKNQIKQATYKVASEFKWTNYVDGTTYKIYVKGDKDDVFLIYAAMFFNPKDNNSYSCTSISLALWIFTTKENDDFRTVPITKLTSYLIDVKEGRSPATDPSINEPIPDPEFELPPP
jgi:hypothetical protein